MKIKLMLKIFKNKKIESNFMSFKNSMHKQKKKEIIIIHYINV